MSDYRDDSEALHERVASLQQELDGTREDLERERAKGTADDRAEKLREELNESRARLTAMEKELAALRPEKPPFNYAPIIVGAGAVGAMALIAVMIAGTTKPASSPASVKLTAPTSPPVITTVVTPTITPITPIPPVPQGLGRALAVTWPAKVSVSNGAKQHVGDACSIAMQLQENGESLNYSNVVLRCGNESLYDSKIMRAGVSQSGGSVRQTFGKDKGTVVFDLTSYSDTGSGNTPQITIDGAKGMAYVWHDYPNEFRLELAFARVSPPVASAPLGPVARLAIDENFRVTALSGRATPALGTTCRMQSLPSSASNQSVCYVTVVCERGLALYGGVPFKNSAACNAYDVLAGRGTLTLDDTKPSKVDKDPRLHYSVADGVLTIADEPEAIVPWSVELARVNAGDGGAN